MKASQRCGTVLGYLDSEAFTIEAHGECLDEAVFVFDNQDCWSSHVWGTSRSGM